MGAAGVLGIITGLTTGFLAVGVVLVYKANRFINLAHAQMGTYSAVLLAKMVLDWKWSWWAAFPVAVGLGVATGLAVERYIVRPLRARTGSAVTLLLVTIGVSQLLSALEFVPALGPDASKLTLEGYPIPFQAHFTVQGVVLGGQYILVLVLVPAVVAGLTLFLRYTAMGRMIRAAANNPDAARLCGVSISRVSMVTWGVAGALSAVTAVLVAPSQPSFDAAALGPDLLLRALGAAAVGGFVSIPAALAGGVGISLAEQITLHFTHSGGEADLVVFVVILGILVVRSRAISGAARAAGNVVEELPPLRIPESVASRGIVRHQRRLLIGLGLFLGVIFPLLPYFRPNADRFDLSLVLTYALLGVAATMLVGWAGQVSLGHFALVGIGAYLTARLTPHGLTIPVVVVLCGLVGAAVMVVTGLPALRIRGLTLAITSLGVAVVAPAWLFNQAWFGSTRPYGLVVTPPGLRGLGTPSTQLSVYYLCLIVLVVGLVAAAALRRSLAGKMIVAVRDNEATAQSFGVTPAAVKLGILAVSGFFAATAGVLWADAWQNLSVSQFNPDLSLSVLAVPVIGGLGSISGAVAGATVLYMLTFFIAPHLSSVFGSVGHGIGFQLLLGGGGQVLMLLSYPTGLAGFAQQRWQAFLDAMAAREASEEGTEVAADALVVEGLRLTFGGIKALDGASIRVSPGEIVGLIGPNGAGKSTLMNVVSGLLAGEGSVRLRGTEISALSPDERWLHGLSRTFQDARLFPGLTVRDTIHLAVRDEDRPGVLGGLLRSPWSLIAESDGLERADGIIDEFGLRPWAGTLVSDLSTGTRRICDLACQVAARPRVLMLDEPTGGVAQREAEQMPPLLRRIRDELGCAILVIEHDMPMLMSLCDRIYAMESGRVIAEGTPSEVRNDPAVVASYLGSSEAAIGRSGRTRSRPPGRPRRPAAAP